MVTRRYRVGIDIDKYAKRFIVGCIVSFLFGACLCTTVVSRFNFLVHLLPKLVNIRLAIFIFEHNSHFEMLRAIQRDGEVELRDLPNDPVNKVTLNTINVFMLGSGLLPPWTHGF